MIMKRLIYFLPILVLGLFSCNPKIDLGKIIPSHVDNFATGFISEIHKGNVDSCLTMLQPEIINDDAKQFLINTFNNIRLLNIDSCRIINARYTNFQGDNDEFTNYSIEYEYITGDNFLYFNFGIKEQNQKLLITTFNGNILETSLSDLHSFTLKGKGFLHYLFMFFAILIPLFILVTLIFIIKTKLKRKWLWIIGVLFGFIKFILNWTTGQFALQPISIMILGAGYSKSGIVAPWMLSFSIPIVAIVFWYRRYWDKKEAEAQKRIDERMKTQENKTDSE